MRLRLSISMIDRSTIRVSKISGLTLVSMTDLTLVLEFELGSGLRLSPALESVLPLGLLIALFLAVGTAAGSSDGSSFLAIPQQPCT